MVDEVVVGGSLETPGQESKTEEPQKHRKNGLVCWRGTTRGERYLMLALTTVLFVAVLLAFGLASVVLSHQDERGTRLPEAKPLLSRAKPQPRTPSSSSFVPGTTNEICLTQGCVKAAAAVIERLDERASPCQDFFEFACGSFVRTEVIPDEKSSINMFSLVDDELKEKLRRLVMEDAVGDDPPATVKAKDLYASCMDRDAIDALGLTPLTGILTMFGGWPVVEGNTWDETQFSWADTNYKSRDTGYSFDNLFDFSVLTDLKNSSWRTIWIDQPSLTLSREYMMRGLNDSDMQANLKYSIDAAVLLGANQQDAEAQMKDVMEFQIEVATISLPREERRNMTKIYNILTLEEMNQIMPDISWVEYVNKMLPNIPVDKTETIVVSDPNYFRNLTKLLSETPKRVLANYMMWRVVTQSASYLSEDIRDIELEFTKKLTGKATRPPRWKECMELVLENLGFALGNMYVRNFFNEDAKAQSEELVKYLREEFDTILDKIDWMDEKTRVQAKKKAGAMKSHIAYPKELLMDEKLTEHYSDLRIDTKSLIDNMGRISIFNTNESFKKLKEMVDKLDWKKTANVALVNAFYSFLENSMQFPAGILQGVFFEVDRPKYMNFGAIGFVIGHEITHGFDDQGKQFDADGNLKNWWEKATERKFLEKAKCIIHQYGNYTAPENGMMINGINTQGENIADNGGIKEAYNAYQKYVASKGVTEPTLPGLEYSANQLFWISAAQVWCGKYRPESLKINILTGEHSPGRFRIIGSFSNSEDFAQDWKCPLGSKMNPRNKCTVW